MRLMFLCVAFVESEPAVAAAEPTPAIQGPCERPRAYGHPNVRNPALYQKSIRSGAMPPTRPSWPPTRQMHSVSGMRQMHSVSDPCWAAATKHLTTRTLLELESEAFGWRQNLSASLQRYYDDEHAAYLATAPGLEANIIQRWQAEYMPRPGASWPSEEDGKYWTRRNRKKGFYGTLDHPLRVRPDLVRDRDELSMSSEAYTRRRWDFFLPTGSVARMKGTACRDPTPLVPRGHHDDHKVVCRTKELTGRNCTVYSIGSNSEWEFENALIKTYPKCKVHTFDCTSGPPQKDSDDRTTQMAYGHYKRGQLQFHKICSLHHTVRPI